MQRLAVGQDGPGVNSDPASICRELDGVSPGQQKGIPGLRVTILGSGSGGNCALVESGTTRLLVDAGFSGKQIVERLLALGIDPQTLAGVLLTHEHGDHVVGLPGLTRRYGLPIYCNRLTRQAVQTGIKATVDWKLFQTGTTFSIGALSIESFPVPHDAYDPVGFVIQGGGRTAGFLTDLGYATHAVIERVRQAEILVLEANHDPELLRADPKRPWAVKQRILARHGHLSNAAAAEVAGEVVTERLRHLFLGHLSEDCNSPELAETCVARKLAERGADHVCLHRTSQHTFSAPVHVG
ncbi:MAG: MBL fold metallo-hydrolase [Candidatus Methylacidiphilales bacterium]